MAMFLASEDKYVLKHPTKLSAKMCSVVHCRHHVSTSSDMSCLAKEIIFLISLEDDINDPSAFQASFVPESISGCSGHAGEHCSQNPEKRSNDQNAHLAHKYPVQVKLPGGCVKTLYAEAVDGMSAADIARKFIDQNCLKPGFVKPLEWVVGAIWENARSKYYPAHTREIYICARRQFQCTQLGLTFNREKWIDW